MVSFNCVEFFRGLITPSTLKDFTRIVSQRSELYKEKDKKHIHCAE